MQLKIAFSLSGWLVGRDDLDGATFFELTDPPAASVSFRKLGDDDAGTHERAGDILVTSTGSFEPPRKIREWLETSEPVQMMPADLATGTLERTRQLLNAARKVVRVVHWVAARTDEMKPTKSLRPCEFQVVEGGPWRRIEPAISLKVSFRSLGRTISGAVLDEVRQVLRGGGEEPLSNVLLSEAWSLLATSPRGALVLGIASLESCVKRLIVVCVPDSQWLVENVPSPPIESMLRDFVGKLKTKASINGKVVPPPQALLKTIKNAVVLRNQVVHGISRDVSSEKVEEYLRAIADINLLMDCYAGNTWAIKNMSHETTKALTESLGLAPK